jgi:hypothetical protein
MARELIAIEDKFEDTLKPAPPMGADDRAGEPVEEAVANVTGELPTMTDQDEQQYPPSRAAAKKGPGQEGNARSPALSAVRQRAPHAPLLPFETLP